MFAPTVLLATAAWSLAQFPGRYQRVLDRAQADEWLSQGEPFPPPTEEEERAKKEREDAARAEEEAAAAAKEEEAKALAALSAEERDAKETQKKLLAEKKRVAEKAAAEKAKAEAPKETFSWESLNPLAALQKQMDEVFAMITLSQSILDEVAGGLERVAGVLSWEEPRVTAGFLCAILVSAWALVYVEVVTRFFVKIILGVVVKTIFTVVSPSTLKFGASAGILFAMRHPAILPDEKTKVLQEAKARAAREAALAAELANDDDDASQSVVAATPAPPAPPSAPLAPLNVFFRMPTQSDRLL
jgi:flagellar biosynthesis GTPase FlhF